MLPREFHFYVDGSAIRNTVTPDVSLTVVADVDDATVFREELAYRVVSRYAAVLTESHDNLVL